MKLRPFVVTSQARMPAGGQDVLFYPGLHQMVLSVGLSRRTCDHTTNMFLLDRTRFAKQNVWVAPMKLRHFDAVKYGRNHIIMNAE